jgi:hypothetical protein
MPSMKSMKRLAKSAAKAVAAIATLWMFIGIAFWEPLLTPAGPLGSYYWLALPIVPMTVLFVVCAPFIDKDDPA